MREELPRNFRDIAEGVNEAASRSLLVPGQVYRSGEIHSLGFLHEMGIRTVISLRRTPDPIAQGIEMIQIAPREKMNNYEYETAVFMEWLECLFVKLTEVSFPILLHCTAGKDRTGVAVGLLLKAIGIKDDFVLADYRLSDGQTYEQSLQATLNGYKFSNSILAATETLSGKLVDTPQ